MSYTDDELKIGEPGGDNLDLDLDTTPNDPLDDDLAVSDDGGEDEATEGFAGLDGAEY